MHVVHDWDKEWHKIITLIKYFQLQLLCVDHMMGSGLSFGALAKG